MQFFFPGQSNYAAGSTFQDTFAHWLAEHKDYPVRVMNWGYWGSIGIVASRNYCEQMAAQGIGSIEPAEGMEALKKLLSAPMNRVAFIKTTDTFDWKSITSDEAITVSPQNKAVDLNNILGAF